MNKTQVKTTAVLQLEHVKKSFMQGGQHVPVLHDISFSIAPSQVVALVGQSGSGKSTLLQITGLLEKPDAGRILMLGEDVSEVGDALRTQLRNRHIGVVYQYHHLLGDFSALENVMMPRLLNGIAKSKAKEEATHLLTSLGLEHRLEHRPAQLSGGEQQRVAIARAMINKPSILLADEPTGNLDPNSCQQVFRLLLQTAKDHHIAVLLVTHNLELAKECDVTLLLEGGKITNQ